MNYKNTAIIATIAKLYANLCCIGLVFFAIVICRSLYLYQLALRILGNNPTADRIAICAGFFLSSKDSKRAIYLFIGYNSIRRAIFYLTFADIVHLIRNFNIHAI